MILIKGFIMKQSAIINELRNEKENKKSGVCPQMSCHRNWKSSLEQHFPCSANRVIDGSCVPCCSSKNLFLYSLREQLFLKGQHFISFPQSAQTKARELQICHDCIFTNSHLPIHPIPFDAI